ncbi:hypothetical protein M747DRAFT_118187 [Aspergillus niger ATCC 13496]|uniref:C2H2-type domain-containing protein n=1 Tax=Aspergillus niger ATCC 13496 TaxID=1353008 RepID=A0A370CD49_ASPNG|nr:hypothetical protein M747DRAFT_118187 [Aspergillus niger ATCC 13496]
MDKNTEISVNIHDKREFACSQCPRSYSRIDHLSRHARSHLLSNPYQCDICHRGFSRRDLLQRHKTIHEARGGLPRKLDRQGRTSRACLACGMAKLKCNESKPCSRCLSRQIPCKSLPDRRRQPRPKNTTLSPCLSNRTAIPLRRSADVAWAQSTRDPCLTNRQLDDYPPSIPGFREQT